jgi:hypothetical protein
MTIDVPVLRLGLAGFGEAQQQQADAVAHAAGTARAQWRISSFTEADAWWLDGQHTQVLPNGMLRVSPAVLTQRAVQLTLADVDRPVAFTRPIAARGFAPPITFELVDTAAAVVTLHKFASWLQPMLAQYCLAASIAEHQPALSSGSWEVLRGGELLAVVDLRIGAAVVSGAAPADFEEATWLLRDPGDVQVPDNFLRGSLSAIMWEYALRTHRDLLPPHYRSRPLYFRRPPRLPQRQLNDAHLLLMRELAAQPGMRMAQLQEATGFPEAQLARHLAALYFVGAITANPRRAAVIERRHEAQDSRPGASMLPSVLESGPQAPVALPRKALNDLTAPAPLLPE